MKLKNKLLPLVGIGAACAAVTPIALTSCKSSDLVNLMNEYKLQYEAVDGSSGPYSQSQVNSFYFQEAQKNPNIFADDLYWTYSYMNRAYYAPKTTGSDTTSAAPAIFVADDDQLHLITNANIAVGLNAKAALANELNEKLTASGEYGDTTNGYVANTDNEKLENISVKVVTYKTDPLYLVSYKHTFDRNYDVATVERKGGGSRESTESNLIEHGSVEYHNIPFYLRLIEQDEISGSTTIGANCWQIAFIDPTTSDEAATLWYYLIESEEYQSFIDVNVNIDTTSVTSSGKTTSDSNIYEFKIDSDTDLETAWYILENDIMEFLQPQCVSHYVWNLGWNGK